MSARAAWDALRTGFPEPRAVQGFQFGAVNRDVSANGLMVSARTGPGAVATALSRRWGAHLVLVWHLALLRLLPFLRVYPPLDALRADRRFQALEASLGFPKA